MFRSFLVGVVAIAIIAARSPAENVRPPNIILILADDLGYETIGANGGESYKTPNLDRLASTGIRFERCNVQPLCTPTRVQLMTGMSNARNYIEFGSMDPKATTFGNLLKNAGYATAIAGKWQLGRDRDLPQRFGFDESCLWQHTRRPPRYANPGLEYNGVARDFTKGEYGPDLVSDFALEFIEKNKSKPFFLYYPMMLTHAPYQPTPDSSEYDPKATGEEKKNNKYFADMVTYMDKLVGKLVKQVDDAGIRNNTLIIFLGDNGTGKGVTSRFKGTGYGGGKGLTTARGMHVPLIANWTGHTPEGRTNDDLIDSTDFLPTICAAAGAKIPDTLRLDGQSFLPQLKGEAGQPREWIYNWYSQNGQPPIREFVTTKDYKLYRNGRFYNLKKDPFEENTPQQLADLTGDEAAAAQKLQDVLISYADARPSALAAKSKSSADPAAKKAAKRSPEERAARRARRAARQAGQNDS
jgi:arylsulfatase A